MCKLCQIDKEILLNYDYANTEFEVTLDQENVLNVAYNDTENDFMDYVQIHINYCPMCGRNLGVE